METGSTPQDAGPQSIEIEAYMDYIKKHKQFLEDYKSAYRERTQ